MSENQDKLFCSFYIRKVYLDKFVLHTYIYNWPLQPFSQDNGLASHTTHVVCVNFRCE